MHRSIPLYRDHDEIYEADSCRPLVNAVSAGLVRFAALARGHYPGRRLRGDGLLGIKTVGHRDADWRQQWGLPWHRNEGIELSFLESGRTGLGVDGGAYQLQPDDCTSRGHGRCTAWATPWSAPDACTG